MHPAFVSDLVAVERDFLSADDILDGLMRRFAALPLDGVLAAVGELADIRSRLFRVLGTLDGPIADAVRLLDAGGVPPPF